MNRAWIVTALTATALLTGCTTYAKPDTALKGVSYTGGEWDSKAFLKCVEPGSNESVDNGGDTYYYPVGTRRWTFGNTPGADSGPILVSTNNNVELIQGGTITFNLDTSCEPYTDKTGRVWPGGKLQMFHDTIGRSAGAFFGEESTQVPDGWRNVLGAYLGGPGNRVMDAAGGNYTWQQLYTDKKSVDDFIAKVKTDLPGQLSALTGGENFFTIIDIQLDKPDLPGPLKDAQTAAEVEKKNQETAKSTQQVAQEFPGGPQAYQVWQQAEANRKETEAKAQCLATGKCNIVVAGVSG
jgi:hypothetical protein